MSNDETKPEEEVTPSEEKTDEVREGSPETASAVPSESDSERDEDESAEEKSGDEPEAPKSVAAAAPTKAREASGGGGKIIAFAAVALLVGGGAGWFGRELVRKQTIAKATDACDSWKTKVCGELGEKSPACKDATAVKSLLPAAACVSALDEVQTTVRSAKAARAVCDNLVTRLCAEIGPTTDTCKMITEQTQSFPTERCDQMTAQYDKVAESVRQLAAQQEMMRQGGGMPGGMPGGGAPMRMPPGMSSPHGPGGPQGPASPHGAAPAPH